VLVDVQPYFVGKMHGLTDPVLVRLEQLLLLCEWYMMPVLATLEEPVARKGYLHERLTAKWPSKPDARAETLTKQAYGALAEPELARTIEGFGCRRVVVAGGETDVCVMQTVLQLLDQGYEVMLLEDCVFSSEPNTSIAIARMRSAGAVPCTYKSLFYELRGTDDPAAWAEEQAHATASGLVEPETLPSALQEFNLDGLLDTPRA